MHPLPPQVAVDPADPDSYAAEQILSTLAENRKWLNEMEETSNISMRIFEYSALIFLVMLLKFVTENTRDIYVRLTSPVSSGSVGSMFLRQVKLKFGRLASVLRRFAPHLRWTRQSCRRSLPRDKSSPWELKSAKTTILWIRRRPEGP